MSPSDAFGQGHDGNAGEGEALEQARGVFLVAAEAIERLGEDDVDLLAERDSHHRLKAWTHQRCARHRVVRVLLRALPTFALRVLPADAELVDDRRLALIVRRVAGVDGNLHGRRSEHVSSSPHSRSKISRAA